MRDTKYATELATASIALGPQAEARMEKLHIKEKGRDEIRFSWWKENRLIPRPLDVTEDQLFELFEDAIQKGVFSPDFLGRLSQLLQGR